MNTFLTVYYTLHKTVKQIFNILKLPEREHPKGRKSKLTNSEAVTVAILKQKQNTATKKSFFEILEPPCEYNAFVRAINKSQKYLAQVIIMLLSMARENTHLIKFTDSTDIPVCLNKNANTHKTMRALSSWAKTGKGYFYGLKLHLSGDLDNRVLALSIAPAHIGERKIFKKINEGLTGVFVADAGYVSKDLERDFYIENERMLITALRKTTKKLSTRGHIALLNLRMRVEMHFRELKLFYGLVTSLPRSVDGYLTHYLASICAYLLS